MNQSVYLGRQGLLRSLIMNGQVIMFDCLGTSDGVIRNYVPSVHTGGLTKVDVISCLQDLSSPSVIELAYSINDKFVVLGKYDFEKYTLLNSHLEKMTGAKSVLSTLRVNGVLQGGKYRQTFWVFKQGTSVLSVLKSLLR